MTLERSNDGKNNTNATLLLLVSSWSVHLDVDPLTSLRIRIEPLKIGESIGFEYTVKSMGLDDMSTYIICMPCVESFLSLISRHQNMSVFALKGISVSGSHPSLSLPPPTFLSAETQGEARVAVWTGG